MRLVVLTLLIALVVSGCETPEVVVGGGYNRPYFVEPVIRPEISVPLFFRPGFGHDHGWHGGRR